MICQGLQNSNWFPNWPLHWIKMSVSGAISLSLGTDKLIFAIILIDLWAATFSCKKMHFFFNKCGRFLTVSSFSRSNNVHPGKKKKSLELRLKRSKQLSESRTHWRFWSIVSKRTIHFAVSFLRPKFSCKIWTTDPIDMLAASAN